jgi:pyruvate,water dikinase
VARVGGQNASLGEMVHNLDKRGVPVPPEFATTADVYWCYINASGLKQMITTALTAFVSFLMPGETKVFPTAQAAEAWQWIIGAHHE